MVKTKKRHKVILSVYLLVHKNEKTLLHLRNNTGYCDGMYSLIAGHVEEKESLTEAMIREAKEEAGMDISKTNLKLACTIHRKSDDERIDFFFELINWKGTIENKEPHKCKELKFFDIKNLPDNTIQYIKKAIYNSLNNVIYSEHGWKKRFE